MPWVLLMASVVINVYLLVDNAKQKELTEIHQKLARQKEEELSTLETRFEEHLSVAKAAYARAEAQLEEAKKNLEED